MAQAFLVAWTVKNLSAMQETWVQSLDQKDPLEKGIASHSSTPAWRIPWTEEPGGLQSTMSLPKHGSEYDRNGIKEVTPLWKSGNASHHCA